jgi:carbonic anhydrase
MNSISFQYLTKRTFWGGAKILLFFCGGLGAMCALAADDKAKEPAKPQAQVTKPTAPTSPEVAKPVSPVAPTVAKSAAQPASPKVSAMTDQDMSEILLQKINKSSGDIVLRSSDLPPPFPTPKPEVKAEAKPLAKPEVKSEPKADAKLQAKPKVEEPVVAALEIPWTYADGPGGPDNWINLNKENVLCGKGKMQSPININFDNVVKGDLSPIVFEYRPFFLSILDNGRSVEVIGAEGNTIFMNEKQYRLVGFDFHKPSEEAFNGERFEMSVHLVHQHFDGSRVIVAVMLSSSPKLWAALKKSWWDKPPKESPLFQIILNNVPLVKNQVVSPRDVSINPNQLLPEDRTYFTYMGSLTEPPCTEGVTWVVMKNPVLVSAQQVHSFGQIYNNNARPLQIKGDRIIKESR